MPSFVSYTLELTGGISLNILGIGESVNFVQDFSYILQLRPSYEPGFSSLVFINSKLNLSSNSELENEFLSQTGRQLPDRNWSCRDLESVRLWEHPETDDKLIELTTISEQIDIWIAMWRSLTPIYEMVVEHGGFPLHSGAAIRNEAIDLFPGKGSSGKSTAMSRLPNDWRVIADDEVLVIPNGYNRFRAHPLPTWSDYMDCRGTPTWDVKYSAGVDGVYLIRKGQTDELKPVSEVDAVVSLFARAHEKCSAGFGAMSLSNRRNIRKKLMDNIIRFVKKRPVQQLVMSLDGDFWNLLTP